MSDKLNRRRAVAAAKAEFHDLTHEQKLCRGHRALSTSTENPVWEELIELGLAKRGSQTHGRGGGTTKEYRLTPWGRFVFEIASS